MAAKNRQWPPPPQEHSIQLEIEGKTYKGTYHTERGEVVVRLLEDWSSKKAELRRSDPESVARILLNELVTAFRLKQKQRG